VGWKELGSGLGGPAGHVGTHLCVHQGDADPVVMEQHAALGAVEIQLLGREGRMGDPGFARAPLWHVAPLPVHLGPTHIHEQAEGHVVADAAVPPGLGRQVGEPHAGDPVLVEVGVEALELLALVLRHEACGRAEAQRHGPHASGGRALLGTVPSRNTGLSK